MSKKPKNENHNNKYKGLYPTVFKKVDKSQTKFTPFNAYKKFTFLSGSNSDNAEALQGVYTNTLPALGTELTYNDAANADGSLQSITYYSINHLYYKRKGEPSKTFGPTDLTRSPKYLYETASIFIIPQSKIGEGIKPRSFSYTGSVNLASDRYGNVYDVDTDISSFAGEETFYEGFNEYFDVSRILYATHSGVTYGDGVTTTTGAQLPIGLSAHFSGSSYFATPIDGYYDRDHDYAISFFSSGSNNGPDNYLILGKLESDSSQYPFKVELDGNNQIIFSAAASDNLVAQVTSSDSGSDWRHVVCQKSGSNLEIFVDTVNESSAAFSFLRDTVTHPLSASGYIHNDSDVYFGSLVGVPTTAIIDLDEVRIFNKSLTGANISSLGNRNEHGTLLQTNKVGNVFDKHGTVVVSSPDYIYHDVITTPYTSSYRSTITLNEFSTVVNIDAGDFNMSTNPSLTKDNGMDYKAFVSGSDFGPYITTIGLYNEQGQLLAVGKLASPLQKRSDVDTNILLRIDLES